LSIADVAASFQHTVCTILANKTLSAAAEHGESVICLAGGVAANSYLRSLLPNAICPELKYCGDNAAMIGSQAYYEYLAGNAGNMSLNATATMKL
jgi:N6-L-threonylcarbamoyladenine synthase